MTENDHIVKVFTHGSVHINVIVYKNMVWLSQADMAKLFKIKLPTVYAHISMLLMSGEIKESVIQRFLIRCGTRDYATRYYPLDVVITVGRHIKCLAEALYAIKVFCKWAHEIVECCKKQVVGNRPHRLLSMPDDVKYGLKGAGR
jgi:hypothetical protein